jgi:hypothetical protein
VVSLTQLVDYLEQLKKMGLQWGWEHVERLFVRRVEFAQVRVGFTGWREGRVGRRLK